jgi:metallophosphoesterase (TIGR00282 family)
MPAACCVRPTGTPGLGWYEGQTKKATPFAVINLQGRVYMVDNDDPFRTADRLLENIRARVILVDMHAEATSEKIAMGWYLDGRVTAVIGTHTHVPTADERVLPKGTAYLTDVGMTGPYDSIIGVEKQQVLERFLTSIPTRFEPATGDVRFSAAVIDCDSASGRATAIERLVLKQ